MIPFPKKVWLLVSLTLLLAIIASVISYPAVSGWLSIILFLSGLGIALLFAFKKHVSPYKEGQITRLKFARNVLLDILGLLLAILAASGLEGSG